MPIYNTTPSQCPSARRALRRSERHHWTIKLSLLCSKCGHESVAATTHRDAVDARRVRWTRVDDVTKTPLVAVVVVVDDDQVGASRNAAGDDDARGAD